MQPTEPQGRRDEYVNWQRGADILGISKGSFFHLVTSGRIIEDKHRRPKDGKYKLADILAEKERRAAQKPRKQYRPRRTHPKPALFDWLTPADIPAALKLDFEIYGEINYDPPRTYQERQRKNPHIAMAAFSQDRSVCLGYITLIPLPEQMCLSIMAKQRTEADIPLEAVETYDRSGGFTLLATSAAIHRERPDLLYRLLYKIMEFWIEQFPERYITRIYTQTISDPGDQLVQHFFMSPMAGYPTDAYYLDMARPSASKIVRWYQTQLAEKAPLPSALTTRFTPPLPK